MMERGNLRPVLNPGPWARKRPLPPSSHRRPPAWLRLCPLGLQFRTRKALGSGGWAGAAGGRRRPMCPEGAGRAQPPVSGPPADSRGHVCWIFHAVC